MQLSHLKLMFVASVLTLNSLMTFAADTKDEETKKDRKRIEGTWKVVTLEIGGKKSSDEDVRKLTVVNSIDGSWSLRSEGKEISKGITVIDPIKQPRTIDFTPTEGGGKGNLHLGIYELNEKTRRLCFTPPGQSRPTEFVSQPGTEQILVTFEREVAK